MRIVIFTNGRFHVLDLARELSACGHEVTFISCLPPGRVAKFGFSAAHHRSHFLWMAPLLAIKRYAPQAAIRQRADQAAILLFDRLVSWTLPACEVCIGMAGMSLCTGVTARRKHGALYVVERGSRHILSQKAILESIPDWPEGKPGVPAFDVKRNLLEYQAADVISVPAKHVMESFTEQGISGDKLFCNPYGVDLEMFPPTRPEPSRPPTVLYAGAWSLQKGVDLLVAACRLLKDVQLLHVGSIGDGPAFPQEPWFRHVDTVPQWQLKEYYAKADVFVQPSRQEGLSLVLVQALACGLPLVCTDRTGGADLREMISDGSLVTVVPHDDVAALAAGIRTGLDRAQRMSGLREGLGSARAALSWSAYGKRYSDYLEQRARRQRV